MTHSQAGATGMGPRIDAVQAGREALARQAWAEARRWFELALSREQTAAALEGLGTAAARLGDGAVAIDAHKRAYWRHQVRNDWRGSARLATWLALDFYTFQQDFALASTWLAAARERLAGLDPVPEHGWLALAEGHLALVAEDDAARAAALGAQAAALGQALGVADLEQEAATLQRRARQRQLEALPPPSEPTAVAPEPAPPAPVVPIVMAPSAPSAPPAPTGRRWALPLRQVWGRRAAPAGRRSLVPVLAALAGIVLLLSIGLVVGLWRPDLAAPPTQPVSPPLAATAVPTLAAERAPAVASPTPGPNGAAAPAGGLSPAPGSGDAGSVAPLASPVPSPRVAAAPSPPPAATRSLATPTLSVAALADLSGEWVHNFGTLRLHQTGTRVSGTYENAFFPGPGTVEATVTGTTVTGRWAREGVTGTIAWTISPDGQTFTGVFKDEGMGETTYPWCGARSNQPFPDGCSFAGAWLARLDDAPPCPLRLTRTNLTVTGTSCQGSINGTITGATGSLQTVLTGTWQAASGETGAVTLYLAGFDARQFQGTVTGSRLGAWCGWREGASPPTPCRWP